MALAKRTAEDLRSIYHQKQRAFYRPAPRGERRFRATRKTRRAGATSGGCREFLARALEIEGFRATYATTTRQEAIDRAWRNDSKSGFIDILDKVGEPVKHPTLLAYSLGGLTVEVRESDLKLEFSNGSQIEMFGGDNIRRHRAKRGNAKHVFWVDECQDFPFLEEFFNAVILSTLQDVQGEAWLTGTPGVDCVGMFYEITRDDAEDGGEASSWEVHTIAQVDNPLFGRVVEQGSRWNVVDNLGGVTGPFGTEAEAEAEAIKVRWRQTVGDAMAVKGWKGNEPDLRREYYGEWVKEDQRLVYPVHTKGIDLLFAPQRLKPNPLVGTHPRFDGHPDWYDHNAALADLPRARRGHPPHEWLFGIGVDFGYNPDPFALVLLAFCHTIPDVYEMFSWKCTKVHTDDQGLYMKLLYDCDDGIVSFVGDPAGKQDDFEVWRTRMNLPIEEANKRGKNTLEEFLADDIRRGRFHLRDGSPLHSEMRHLVYLPGKPGKTREVHKHRKVNGIVHGDHNCFVAGTMIDTERGRIPIESVRLGDRVSTRSGFRPVTIAGRTGAREIWLLDAKDGRVLMGTCDHPVWTGESWSRMDSVMRGDSLTLSCGGSTTVRHIDNTGEARAVYNLTVEGVPEFFANGILVHNCDAARYSYADLTHFLARVPVDKPKPGTREALQIEADVEEKRVDDADRRRARAIADGDEQAAEYGGGRWT